MYNKIHDTLTTGLDFVNDATGTALREGATTVNIKVAFGEGVTDAAQHLQQQHFPVKATDKWSLIYLNG